MHASNEIRVECVRGTQLVRGQAKQMKTLRAFVQLLAAKSPRRNGIDAKREYTGDGVANRRIYAA
jgi:hypothetical protein